MATAEVKLGGSQLLVKHTTKLHLKDESEANVASSKQELALLSTEAEERKGLLKTLLPGGEERPQQEGRTKRADSEGDE